MVRIRFPPPASLSHQCLPCLPPQRPGFCRECEPGRDQRTGPVGPEPARLGCFSLTGIDAVSSPNGRLSEGRVARDIGDYMTFREIFLLISAATGGVM